MIHLGAKFALFQLSKKEKRKICNAFKLMKWSGKQSGFKPVGLFEEKRSFY